MAGIKLVNATKRFSEEVVAVKEMNLEVKDQEFVVFLGPSGCGKTTTLRLIAGLEHADEGDIFIGGIRVNNLSPADRDIALVFQFYALYPHFTVYDNIAFPLRAVKVPKSEIDVRVREVADILHIDGLLNRKPGKLSGGEQQRVALGRAMVRRPKAFLMDEPLSNLDAKFRAETRAEIKRLQNDLGATTIYVTHDQVEAMAMGDRIAVMNLGMLQQIGTPAEIYEKPANLFVADFVGSPAMNFLDCHIQEIGDTASLNIANTEVSIEIRDKLKNKIEREATNGNLVLGIRAEDIFIYTEARYEYIEAEVYVIEPLGSENIIDISIGKHPQTNEDILLKVRTLPTFTANIGQRLWIDFDRGRMHIFDKKTQKAIL